MKKSEKLRARIADTLAKINSITRHIRNVEDNCVLLGTHLIERGDIELGHRLIANGMVHDASKLCGIEFEYLSLNNPSEENTKIKLKLAIHHHQKTNPHHVEYWAGGISEMPDVYLAEFCCDIKARSEEFGTNVRTWIDETAIQKYEFTKEGPVYKKIMSYIDVLCAKPFEDLSK